MSESGRVRRPSWLSCTCENAARWGAIGAVFGVLATVWPDRRGRL